LGAYLGDGTVYHQAPRFWDLRIVDDRRYQQISEQIRAAMTATFPRWIGANLAFLPW
jgi:hypothetical protein